jgi:hypothetical protein
VTKKKLCGEKYGEETSGFSEECSEKTNPECQKFRGAITTLLSKDSPVWNEKTHLNTSS